MLGRHLRPSLWSKDLTTHKQIVKHRVADTAYEALAGCGSTAERVIAQGS